MSLHHCLYKFILVITYTCEKSTIHNHLFVALWIKPHRFNPPENYIIHLSADTN